MLSAITVLLAAFAIAAVVAQPSPAECNVDPVSGTESCCLPGLPGASLCANVTWVPTQQAIKTSISIGALQLLAYQFDANNTKACAGNPAQASVCAQINNFTVTAQGCCGCLYVDATIASIFNLASTLTCFAFGQISTCPGVACNNFSTCNSCDLNPQCGYCATANGQPGQCLPGTQKGPTSGSCAAPNSWDFHVSQC
jgi:hypothetical protein